MEDVLKYTRKLFTMITRNVQLNNSVTRGVEQYIN